AVAQVTLRYSFTGSSCRSCSPAGAHQGTPLRLAGSGTAQTRPSLQPAAAIPRAGVNRPRLFSRDSTGVSSTAWTQVRGSLSLGKGSYGTSTGVRLMDTA